MILVSVDDVILFANYQDSKWKEAVSDFIFGRLQFQETFQLSRINATNIVSSTDVTFRKTFHVKERSLT